jgi:hypothetical protein
MPHETWLGDNNFEVMYDLYGPCWLGSGFRCRDTNQGWIATQNNIISKEHGSPEGALRSLGWIPKDEHSRGIHSAVGLGASS